MKEEDILHKRYENFTADNDWVQHVRGSLLGLEDGATPSREDINTLGHFVPQVAASEPEPPEVVADHWLPILQEQGYLAECHPDQFMAAEDWVPLYTPEGLEKHLPANHSKTDLHMKLLKSPGINRKGTKIFHNSLIEITDVFTVQEIIKPETVQQHGNSRPQPLTTLLVVQPCKSNGKDRKDWTWNATKWKDRKRKETE